MRRAVRILEAAGDKAAAKKLREADKNDDNAWELVEILLHHLLQKSPQTQNPASQISASTTASLTQQLNRLPRRQRDVLCLLRSGLHYKQIARKLNITHATVRVMVANLRKQLGTEIVPILRREKQRAA